MSMQVGSTHDMYDAGSADGASLVEEESAQKRPPLLQARGGGAGA